MSIRKKFQKKSLTLFGIFLTLIIPACGQIKSKKNFVEDESSDLESKFAKTTVNSDWKTELTDTNIEVINGLFFVDDLNGWIVGAFNKIYRTKNGGKDWKKVDVEIPEKTAVSKVFFANENDGWMVVAKYNLSILERGQNQFWIYKTADGGESWALQYSVNQAVFSEIRFRNGSEGYVTGYTYTDPESKPMKAADGLLLKTLNGGKDWEDISKEFNNLKTIEDRGSSPQYMNDSAGHINFGDLSQIRMITFHGGLSRLPMEEKIGPRSVNMHTMIRKLES